MFNPRRVSILESDPDCDLEYARRCTVYLDGEPLEYCVAADEEKGEATVCLLNVNREPIQRNGEPLTRILQGVVVIQDHGARVH